MVARHSKIGVSLLFSMMVIDAGPAGADEPSWAWLDNGTMRLGVRRDMGGGIGWLSPSGSERNLVNHADHGRLVQQSYYGDPDGSRWGDKPWKWNPVQGGDYKGHPSEVLAWHADKDRIAAKVRPRNWAVGQLLDDVTLEQAVTLDGPLAHVHFRMTYTGDKTFRPTHQEIPAVFLRPDLDTLLIYDGPKPWTGEPVRRLKPGFPNEYFRPTERWAAYVDKDGFGLGAYVPAATELTAYCYRDGGKTDCSYFAPIATFAIKPGLAFEYDLILAVGREDAIRAAFRKRAERPGP